ncbi:LYR motif-containing protein 4 [Fopius arisanus]|uniref:LYR motif-containing protein 4 n=1 Tax=Fopius arisanus TaxID=64838 RepID=A0A9R1U5E0_9HYME|nr:PREDICTED: LYR motif-containing protein 4 [Fopius arisanus]
MMSCGRAAVLNLYRNLIRESKKWNSYNYREYALAKIRHEFHVNRCIADSGKIDAIYNKGLESLEMIKRQVIVGNLYATRPLVIETKDKDKLQSCG